MFEAFWSDDPRKALMHGPTYMGNALACAAANASLDLFEREPRLAQVAAISEQMTRELAPCRGLPGVKDVRVKGAIGVVELDRIADIQALRARFVEEGVFIRPFGDYHLSDAGLHHRVARAVAIDGRDRQGCGRRNCKGLQMNLIVCAARASRARCCCCFRWARARRSNFPTRPVTLIVPFAAGGTTDIGLRALAAATEKHLGQSIVVENRAGAGGVLGPLQMATNSAPDGYTIAQIPITVFRYPFTRKTTFDPVNDLSYIMSLSGYTFGVVVKKDAPWATFQDFLADAKANPGKISYGTPGAGTTLHLTMEQMLISASL